MASQKTRGFFEGYNIGSERDLLGVVRRLGSFCYFSKNSQWVQNSTAALFNPLHILSPSHCER